MEMNSNLKSLFIFIIFIGFSLTLVSIFTPGWRHYKYPGGPYFGLITYTCGHGNRMVNSDECDHWWRDKHSWEKVVIVFMFLAMLFEIITFFTSLSTYWTTYQAFIPLSFLAFFATTFLLVSIIIYGAKLNNIVAYMPSVTHELNANLTFGYSYWLAVSATIVMAIGTLVGIALSTIPLERPTLLIRN